MRLGGSRGSERALGHWIARCGGRNPLVCNLRLGEGGQQVPLLPSICGPPPPRPPLMSSFTLAASRLAEHLVQSL